MASQHHQVEHSVSVGQIAWFPWLLQSERHSCNCFSSQWVEHHGCDIIVYIFIFKERIRKRQTKQRHLLKTLFCLLSLMLSDTGQYSAGWCLHGNLITAICSWWTSKHHIADAALGKLIAHQSWAFVRILVFLQLMIKRHDSAAAAQICFQAGLRMTWQRCSMTEYCTSFITNCTFLQHCRSNKFTYWPHWGRMCISCCVAMAVAATWWPVSNEWWWVWGKGGWHHVLPGSVPSPWCGLCSPPPLCSAWFCCNTSHSRAASGSASPPIQSQTPLGKKNTKIVSFCKNWCEDAEDVNMLSKIHSN